VTYFGGFLEGVAAFCVAAKLALSEATLRRWYLGAVLKTIGLALLTLIALTGLGIYIAFSYFQSDWAALLASVVWVVIMFLVSGVIASVVMDTFISMFSSEGGLRAGLWGALRGGSVQKRLLWSLRLREFKSLGLSVVASLITIGVMWIPLMVPVAVVFLGFIMARDSFISSERLTYEWGFEPTRLRGFGPSTGFLIGLGIIPAIMSLVPVLGWSGLPILQLASNAYQKKVLEDWSAKKLG
jgi:hypothetical protein